MLGVHRGSLRSGGGGQFQYSIIGISRNRLDTTVTYMYIHVYIYNVLYAIHVANLWSGVHSHGSCVLIGQLRNGCILQRRGGGG